MSFGCLPSAGEHKMPGNQNMKKRPNRNMKDDSHAAPDQRARAGAEFFMGGSLEGDNYYGADADFGIPSQGVVTSAYPAPLDNPPEEWEKPNPEGKPHLGNQTKPKKGDATPGGGW